MQPDENLRQSRPNLLQSLNLQQSLTVYVGSFGEAIIILIATAVSMK
jgi:hypothetical protein